MKKCIKILVPLSACLLSACAGIGLKEKTETYGAKFTGTHATLASCVIKQLQSDSRWVIRGMQYEVRRYRAAAATEIYAYPRGALPGTYARNSPDNPDGVFRYGPPVPKIHVHRPEVDNRPDGNPDYAFVLMIQRTDDETVFATLKGEKYKSDIAWDKLKACSTR
jgi:hypothetical protein